MTKYEIILTASGEERLIATSLEEHMAKKIVAICNKDKELAVPPVIKWVARRAA